MTERLTWRRGAEPLSFEADLPGGVGQARIFFGPAPGWQGNDHWRYHIQCFGAFEQGSPGRDNQQSAADAVNQIWPAVLERARQQAVADEDEDNYLTMIDAAMSVGSVRLEPFNVEFSATPRLHRMLWHLRNRYLAGQHFPPPLEPLVKALSEECYQRRLSEEGQGGPRRQ